MILNEPGKISIMVDGQVVGMTAKRDRIGLRITSLRKMKGMTITELAERADIGRGHLSRIESGKYAVSLDILQAIAEALGMTIDLIDERLTDLAPLKVLTQ